jgi:hypothetical protein
VASVLAKLRDKYSTTSAAPASASASASASTETDAKLAKVEKLMWDESKKMDTSAMGFKAVDESTFIPSDKQSTFCYFSSFVNRFEMFNRNPRRWPPMLHVPSIKRLSGADGYSFEVERWSNMPAPLCVSLHAVHGLFRKDGVYRLHELLFLVNVFSEQFAVPRVSASFLEPLKKTFESSFMSGKREKMSEFEKAFTEFVAKKEVIAFFQCCYVELSTLATALSMGVSSLLNKKSAKGSEAALKGPWRPFHKALTADMVRASNAKTCVTASTSLYNEIVSILAGNSLASAMMLTTQLEEFMKTEPRRDSIMRDVLSGRLNASSIKYSSAAQQLAQAHRARSIDVARKSSATGGEKQSSDAERAAAAAAAPPPAIRLRDNETVEIEAAASVDDDDIDRAAAATAEEEGGDGGDGTRKRAREPVSVDGDADATDEKDANSTREKTRKRRKVESDDDEKDTPASAAAGADEADDPDATDTDEAMPDATTGVVSDMDGDIPSSQPSPKTRARWARLKAARVAENACLPKVDVDLTVSESQASTQSQQGAPNPNANANADE